MKASIRFDRQRHSSAKLQTPDDSPRSSAGRDRRVGGPSPLAETAARAEAGLRNPHPAAFSDRAIGEWLRPAEPMPAAKAAPSAVSRHTLALRLRAADGEIWTALAPVRLKALR